MLCYPTNAEQQAVSLETYPLYPLIMIKIQLKFKKNNNKNKSNKNNHDPHRLTKYKTLYQSEQLHPILVIIPVMTKATS